MTDPRKWDAAARKKLRRELLAALLGFIGVVLIWRAVWDIAVATMSPETSLVIGLALIGIVAFLNIDYLKKIF